MAKNICQDPCTSHGLTPAYAWLGNPIKEHGSSLTLGVLKCLLGDQKEEKIRITNKWGKPQKLKKKNQEV